MLHTLRSALKRLLTVSNHIKYIEYYTVAMETNLLVTSHLITVMDSTVIRRAFVKSVTDDITEVDEPIICAVHCRSNCGLIRQATLNYGNSQSICIWCGGNLRLAHFAQQIDKKVYQKISFIGWKAGMF